MNAQRDRQRAVELQKEAWNYSLGRGGVPHDPRRAYQLYISVCTLAPDLEGCGVAAGMLLDDPVAYRGEGSDRDPVLLERVILGLAEPGCRAGDLQACFASAYTQRRAGRQVTAPAFRGIEAEEYEAYAARRREYQREQAALRAQPAPARLPPAPPSGATLPAPVAALAPAAAPAAASPPRITSEGNGTAAYWIAEHKRLNYQGTEWMMKALLLEPDNAEAHHLLGEIYARKEWDLDRAVAEAQRATTLEPGNASYWRGLGVVLARAQRRPEALRALQKSKELEPADPKTQLELGRVLCAAGRRQEAISAFETALDRQPELPQALDDYNRCRSRLGLAALKSQPPRAAAARP